MRSELSRMALLGLVSLGSMAAGANTLRAETIYNVSTGLDASDNVLTSGGLSDAHWTVSEQAGGIGAAQSVFPNNADWYGGWLANNSSSDWIARNASITNNGAAPYTFTTTFDLTGDNLASVALSGGFAIDDAGTLALNGTQIGSVPDSAWGSLTSFSVAAGSSLFLQGVNTLTLTITESDNYLEGVRLQGAVSLAVPEPATIISTVIGGIMVLGCRRMFRRGSPR